MYPAYDVLTKRDSPSWNDATRAVVDERLALTIPEGALDETQLATLARLVAHICPDPAGHARTTTLAMVVRMIADDTCDGTRHHQLPGTAECWRRGLDLFEAEAQIRHAQAFAALSDTDADAVIGAVSQGEVEADWSALPPKLFWTRRVLPDCVSAHWAQPSLWSDMGFGGPASPRGYVRLGLNRRDPWEAKEADVREKGLPRHRAV